MINQQNDNNNNISPKEKIKFFYKHNKKTIWVIFIILCLFFIGLHALLLISKKFNRQIIPISFFEGKKDDWKFEPSITTDVSKSYNSLQTVEEASNIGLSAGGAKDINNFRENIKNRYLPVPSDITYEGLFYDYYFDTGKKEECKKLFCPSYSYAVSPDPFSKNNEYYLSVGLNSGIKENEFKRKKLNLVVVLDISGSMGSPFDKYYYDRSGSTTATDQTAENTKTKMEIATESIANMLDYLNNDDRLGMVLFDNEAYLAKPLDIVGNTNVEKLKEHLKNIKSQNGTNMSTGLKLGTELFNNVKNNDYEYENRVIFLTDAMPNLGDTKEESLSDILSKNADANIYATAIGVGVDFNTELIGKLSKIKGANYYSVHSAADFKKRLNEEFEFMVTPLVFDLKVTLDAPGYEIEKVFGSPEADGSTGEIMKVNTLFPSDSRDGENKGGLVLLKIKKINDNVSMRLIASYESRDGTKDKDEVTIDFSPQKEFYSSIGIRKGIVLTRYVALLKNWIIDERKELRNKKIENHITRETGIMLPPDSSVELGEWERKSTPLKINKQYQVLFNDFKAYLLNEADATGDQKIEEEAGLLKKIIDNEKKNEDASKLTFTDSNNCFLACKNSGYENGNCLLEQDNKSIYFKLGICSAIKGDAHCANGLCSCYCY